MRKINEQNIRKLFKLNKSYSITLPINDIRNLGWQEKQKLTIKRKGNTLIISDWEK